MFLQGSARRESWLEQFSKAANNQVTTALQFSSMTDTKPQPIWLQPLDSPSFKNARNDLLQTFVASFVIHTLSLWLMIYYLSLSLGSELIWQTLKSTAPVIIGGFLVSFIIFYWLHRHLCTFFILKKTQEKLSLQKESLNYPYISIAGFITWVIAGVLVSLILIDSGLIDKRQVFIHITLASLFSGTLVSILQINLTETIFQKHLFPYLLEGSRLSNISGVLRIPSYVRIQLLVFTTAIGPSAFIYLLHLTQESSNAILLYIIGFTAFNALWQGGFLMSNISRPIGTLKGKLDRFRQGTLEEQPKPIWRTDAFGQFSEMFDDLVSSMKERDFIRSTFSRYLDPSLVEAILNGKHELGGSEMEASVMFADIRDFTALSEQMSPEQVVELLNEYFEDMVQEITATDGVPDKFMGDGLMAIWGVPSADQNHAQKACHAGIAMLSRLNIINENRKNRNLPIISIGIGIHSGKVIAGNIGSRKKMEYTVIGDTVNTSSRLEGLCKTLQAELLISGEVFQQLSKSLQQQFSFACSKQLRGKLKETEIYQYLKPIS